MRASEMDITLKQIGHDDAELRVSVSRGGSLEVLRLLERALPHLRAIAVAERHERLIAAATH
jgi:hypothetical protein